MSQLGESDLEELISVEKNMEVDQITQATILRNQNDGFIIVLNRKKKKKSVNRSREVDISPLNQASHKRDELLSLASKWQIRSEVKCIEDGERST
ncbi:8873_t:CDS:2, partial [Gigaspora rosea]